MLKAVKRLSLGLATSDSAFGKASSLLFEPSFEPSREDNRAMGTKSIEYDEDDIQLIFGRAANKDLNINAETFKATVSFYYFNKKVKVTITPIKPKPAKPRKKEK